MITIGTDDPDEVVVEGGGAYSATHCLDPVPHSAWEHYPSLPAVLSSAYSTAAWPKPIAALYQEARDAAARGAYVDARSICRRALRIAFELEESASGRLIDLITARVDAGRLPHAIQDWAMEVAFIGTEGTDYEEYSHVRESTISQALLFTRTCLQALNDETRR